MSFDLLEAGRRILAMLGPTDALSQAAREACALTGAEAAFAAAANPGQEWRDGVHAGVSGDRRLGVTAAVRSATFGLHREVARRRAAYRVDGGAAAVARALSEASELVVRDVLVVPVFRRGGRVGGVLALVSSREGAFEGVDAGPLDGIARCAATALDNASKFMLAKRDQERLHLFSEATDEAVWEWTLETGAMWWGSGIRKILGGPGLGVEPTHAWKLSRVHPDDLPAIRRSIERAVASSTPSWREEYRFQKDDGSWADVEDRGHLLRDEHGRAFRMVGALRDVTEQRRIAVARQYLVEASMLLAGDLELPRTLQRIVDLAVPTVADGCVIRVTLDGQERRFVAHRDPARLPVLSRLAAWGTTRRLGDGAPVTSPDPLLVEALPPDAYERYAVSPEHLAAMQELAPTSYIVVPLRARGVVLGTMALIDGESRRRFDERDLMLAMALADRASGAIDNRMLFRDLSESRERLEVTLASIGDGVVSTGVDGRVEFLNGAAEKLTGWTAQEARGRPLAEVLPMVHETTGEPVESPVETVLRTGGVVTLLDHTAIVRRDGGRVVVADSAAPIRGRQGETLGVVLVFRDVTDKKRLEEEMIRASKLESLGLLAGGIAHDFNNILTAILANVSIAETRLGPDHPVLPRLAAAGVAGRRAADLTRQLLTFAKGGAPVRASTALPELLADTCAFALQGSRSVLDLDVAEDLDAVDADASQISQVVQNLVINAAQAMPEGGRVRVAARNVQLPEEAPTTPLPPGRYVRVAVSDEGPGIPPSVLDRVFDPFFTTKSTGSGLGLATVYSIVRKHDGHVTVDPGRGRGACFVFYLPSAATPPSVREVPVSLPMPAGGRVLVMDDEAAIRDLATAALAELGLDVVVASHGAEAIERYREALDDGRRFGVVVLDLTVPGGLGGKETLARLREVDPAIRAIVSSGYSNDLALAHARQHGFAAVLRKPYRAGDLARVVADVFALDDAGRVPTSPGRGPS